MTGSGCSPPASKFGLSESRLWPWRPAVCIIYWEPACRRQTLIGNTPKTTKLSLAVGAKKFFCPNIARPAPCDLHKHLVHNVTFSQDILRVKKGKYHGRIIWLNDDVWCLFLPFFFFRLFILLVALTHSCFSYWPVALFIIVINCYLLHPLFNSLLFL